MRNHLRVVQDLFLASISPLRYFTIMWTHRERRGNFLWYAYPRGCVTDLDEFYGHFPFGSVRLVI